MFTSRWLEATWRCRRAGQWERGDRRWGRWACATFGPTWWEAEWRCSRRRWPGRPEGAAPTRHRDTEATGPGNPAGRNSETLCRCWTSSWSGIILFFLQQMSLTRHVEWKHLWMFASYNIIWKQTKMNPRNIMQKEMECWGKYCRFSTWGKKLCNNCN